MRSIFKSLAARVSLFLLLALAAIVVTAGLFWLFLWQTDDVPEIFDELGFQRMRAMQMVALAHQLEDDDPQARVQLRETSEDFEQTIEELRIDATHGTLSVSPDIEQLTGETLQLWKQTDSHIDVLLDPQTDETRQEEARQQIITNGQKLAELSDRIVQDLRVGTETARTRLGWVMLGAVLFNLVLVVVGYLLMRRHLVDPLRRLERAARRLQDGQFSARVPHRHSCEIGTLEETFNEMAEEVETLVESLAEEREFAQTVVEHAPAGVVIHRRGELISANPQFLSMVQVDDLDDLSGDLYEIFEFEDRAEAQKMFAQLSRGGDDPEHARLCLCDSGKGQSKLCRGDEGDRTVEVVSVPIEHRGDEAVLTVLRDITQRQQLNARMMQMDRVIAIGTLVAGVGHEINNPLSFLMTNLEFSSDQIGRFRPRIDDEKTAERMEMVQEALDEAHEGAERIRDIVAQLRSFSRSDDDPHSPLDISRPLESAIRMARGQIRHRARLETRLREVPPVEGNESKLAQVFLNLLVNAAQAIDEGGSQQDTIGVEVYEDDEEVTVEIRDTGCGIDDEAADRIFDPFFTTKAPGEGTGLGLFICQNIIEAHNGVITVDSDTGRGTTVGVTLPAAAPSPDNEPTDADSDLQDTSCTIAVVDDEKMVGKLFERALGRNHDVDVFTEAHQFVEALEQGQRYDLIFCDLMMPDLTGMDLYDVLRDDYPQVLSRVVFITGGAFTSRANRFLEQFDPPLLYKPFTLDELRTFIDEFEPASI